MKSIQWTWVLILLAFACEKEKNETEQVEFQFNFSADAQGWTGDFADYPLGEEAFYELDYQWTSLPEPLDTNTNSLMIAGNNHSDDLFMFVKKKVENLPANMDFNVSFDLELASIYASNSVGIGGSPAESVYIKVGVTLEEPKKTLNTSDFYEMNIDKGNQSQSGNDMEVIGNVGVTDTTTVYTLINRNNEAKPFTFRTDENGEAWIIIGTDSGFEGLSRLYYNNVKVVFKEVSK